MFSAIKSDDTAYPLLKRPRCKILELNELSKSKHWRIEKWWNDDELKSMGLLEDEIDLSEVLKALQNTKGEIERLSKIETPSISDGKVTKIKVIDLFEPSKGNSKYTKKYFKTPRGEYPVYSSQTSDDGIIAFIDSYEKDEDQCLTWTTDGVYAGTVFLREGKFSMTTHCGALTLREEVENKIYLPYIYHILKNKLRKSAIGQEGQNKRVTVSVIKDIPIEIPILPDGNIDLKTQQEMALKFSENELSLDQAMKAKENLIEILNRALPK